MLSQDDADFQCLFTATPVLLLSGNKLTQKLYKVVELNPSANKKD